MSEFSPPIDPSPHPPVTIGVRGAIRANKGERYRHPFSIRFLKEST